MVATSHKAYGSAIDFMALTAGSDRTSGMRRRKLWTNALRAKHRNSARVNLLGDGECQRLRQSGSLLSISIRHCPKAADYLAGLQPTKAVLKRSVG